MQFRIPRCTVAGALYFCLFNAIPAAADEPLHRLQREWWQWAGSIVLGGNPVVDDTGTYCEAGQHGTYWFLGSYPGTSTPTCTVPKGVKLVVPIVTTFCYPEEGFDTDETCIDYIFNALTGYLRKDMTVRLDSVRQPTYDICEIAAAPNDVITNAPPQCVILRRSNRTLFNFVIGQSGYSPTLGAWRLAGQCLARHLVGDRYRHAGGRRAPPQDPGDRDRRSPDPIYGRQVQPDRRTARELNASA